jgi:hypothetical protein
MLSQCSKCGLSKSSGVMGSVLPQCKCDWGMPPTQRTWVGLTEDDKVLIKHDANFNQFMTAGEYADRVQQLTEAKLKEKNT